MRRARTRFGALAALLILAACGSDAAPAATTTTLATPTTAATSTTSSSTTEPSTTSLSTTPTATTNTTATTTITTTVATTTVDVASEPLTIGELLQLGRPIVLAHAGGEDEHPHSTPFAFAESAAAGVDMLDLDVQLTGDGVLVVQHDEDVDRTTNGTGKVVDMSYAQLHELDDAYWFTADCVCRDQPESAYIYRGIRTGERPPPPGYTADDFAMPRFEDIVRRFPSFPLNIEIKNTGDLGVAAAQELARLLTELDRLDNAVVTAFDDSIVTAFHDAAPTVEVTPGLGVSSAWILDGTPLPDGMRILQLPPEFSGIEVLSPANVTRSHAAGYVIWVWPNDRSLENHDSYVDLLRDGMDGLNINFPEEGVAALADFLGGAG